MVKVIAPFLDYLEPEHSLPLDERPGDEGIEGFHAFSGCRMSYLTDCIESFLIEGWRHFGTCPQSMEVELIRGVETTLYLKLRAPKEGEDDLKLAIRL